MSDKLDLQTPDIVSGNIDKIAELFPNCVTESAEGKAIDFDLLKQELSAEIVEGNKERYRLEWPGKREAIVTANIPTTNTLRPIVEDSVDFENTENLYIEGDNLEVLKCLQESYLGKVKMIYIDPPYNTGKDFVYRDNFTQDKDEFNEENANIDEEGNRLVLNPETAGRYHSDWLSMMYPRLKLARNLLSDDGVIFISIDDNEVHNLRKLCDSVFGDINIVNEFAWRRSDNQSNIGNSARVKEYIVCYAKSVKNLSFNKMLLTDKAKKEYRYKDDIGYFRRSILLHKTRGRHTYEVVTHGGKKLRGPWMIKEDELLQLDEQGKIYWTHGGEEQPYGKIYLHESKGQIINDFLGIEFGTNQRGSLEVEALFDKRYFDFPKPISLIKTFVTIGASTDDIILDFFSGSATTAHAVMQLNAEDGGKRKHIMVQLPEKTDEKSEAYKAGYKNICEIGKERIRRAGKKIKEETGADIDYGFRVYRLDSSNMRDVYYKPQDYNQGMMDMFVDNVKPDRTAHDLLTQVMLDWGLQLSLKIEETQINGKQVFKVANNSLLACFDDNIDESFAKEIAKECPLRIVFHDNSFANDTAKENVKQLLKQLSPETEMRVI